ncbi:Quaternary ammonium compound-resistance protein SugE [Andreprevotia sp. IGB-42]|uniref:DMT family transporter n=1 Tax=Andreprevotia sp. IGB-42 TaxID=2497473 RepID=UPI00135A7637|nr:multidrug efflux SMR transporter [Andreprevotia sp. IGB-42]KAF0815214.1 Quaternary ammonium compound-resistance protein SugE [Andreprevotia sp. IGB-42]
MATHWLVLALAVFTEIVWALSLKYVQLHPSPWVVGLSIGLSFVNMALLSYAMRGIPAGTAYAIWTGLGAIGVTIGGIIWFGDALGTARIFFLLLIVGGVVGLKAVS